MIAAELKFPADTVMPDKITAQVTDNIEEVIKKSDGLGDAGVCGGARKRRCCMRKRWLRFMLLFVVVFIQGCCWSTCPQPEIDAVEWHKPVNQGSSAQ